MSRGLETDVVFVPAVEPRTYERDLVGAAREERRRLLFVRTTRAIDKVVVSCAGRRYGPSRYGDGTGASSRKGPSAFVDDICDRLGIGPEDASEYLRSVLG